MTLPASAPPARTGGSQGYLRIATEEAFAPPEMIKIYLDLLEKGAIDDPGFKSLWGFYGSNSSPRATFIHAALQDLGAQRLADMDARGIGKQVIALTSPGTHPLPRDAFNLV